MKTKNSIKSTVKRVTRLISIILMCTVTLTISCKLGADAIHLLEIHRVIDSTSNAQQIVTFIMIAGSINGLLTLGGMYLPYVFKRWKYSKTICKQSMLVLVLIALISCDSNSESLNARWADLNNKIESLNINGDETDEYLYLRDLLDSAKTDSAMNVVEMQYELVVK